MMSSTGFRDAVAMSANNALVARPCPLSRIFSRISALQNCGRQRAQCCVMLARGMADRGAYYQLKKLILTASGRERAEHLFVGYCMRVFSHRVDQCAKRL